MTLDASGLPRCGATRPVPTIENPESVAPQPVRTEVDGIAVSGLLVTARSPRAALVAVHGGATTSAYFDCPGHPELSLLRLAAASGITALALDRPGYGASAPYADRLWEPRSRVDLLYGAVAHLLSGLPGGAGTVLVAHSAGSEQAMRMAADPRGADLLGLELAGTGREHTDIAQRMLWDRPPGTRPRGLNELLWQPAQLYPADIVGGARLAATGPRLEAATVTDWAGTEFPALAAQVRIPVRFTVADHERVWRNDHNGLAAAAAAFTAAPRVVLNRQPGSGHNLSVGRTARAYHLGLLAFIEECLVAADAGLDCSATQFDGVVGTRPGK
ncbi:alpha/beta hydrolase [Nocardia sp. NPDC052254]|uniref:alpha/beta hydrolase n=1 Tax=Nocardia sp. NPDC052254 TaxID=3155681 RepID=UPI003424A715